MGNTRNSLIFSLARVFISFLDFITSLIYRWLYPKSVKLPPITDPLLLKPATELAAMIRKKQLKSMDLVTAYIDRIVEVQSYVNAVVDQRFLEAVEEARKVDELIASEKVPLKELEKEKPFLGVPVSVKESIAMKGMSLSIGLVSRKDIKATKHSAVVEAMIKAGAIPVVMTNIPELCLWIESSNNVYGCTKNPYDLSRTVGGSSGGEGAIIGAAGSVVGLGTDIGGSIRIPCLYNGIFGHKPTSEIVSNDGVYPPAEGESQKFRCTGPMCRYAVDLLPMLTVLAGSNVEKLNLHVPVDLRNIKVYYMADDGGSMLCSSVTSDIKRAQNKVIAYLENEHGIKSQKIFLSQLKNSFNIWKVKFSSARTIPMTVELTDRKGEISLMTEFLKWCLRCSSFTIFALLICLFGKKKSGPENNSKFLKLFDSLKAEMQDILGNDGVFLYPTLPEPAPYHYQTIYKIQSVGYCGIFNILGFPSTHCPLGLDSKGLPLGIQVVGNHHSDRLTIAVAMELEKAFGGWVNPSAVSDNLKITE